MFNEKQIKLFLWATIVFNLIDTVVSIYVIKFGHLKESNPIMDFFLKFDSIMPFVFAKMFLICSGSYIIWKCSGSYIIWKRRDMLIAQLGAYFVFGFYWALIVQFYFFLVLK
jgi:hypothetical protein